MEKNYKIDVVEDVAGITVVKGFRAGAAACDIRNKNDFDRLDTAVIVSDNLATAAGVFTTNDVKAAPVLTDIANLDRTTKVRAIVANSGNANACTGDRGLEDARRTCEFLAEKLGVEADSEVTFDKVIAVGTDDGIKVGAPYVEGASVAAKVLKNGKAKKVTVMTYKPKKNEKRKMGHRQPYTKVEISAINA